MVRWALHMTDPLTLRDRRDSEHSVCPVESGSPGPDRVNTWGEQRTLTTLLAMNTSNEQECVFPKKRRNSGLNHHSLMHRLGNEHCRTHVQDTWPRRFSMWGVFVCVHYSVCTLITTTALFLSSRWFYGPDLGLGVFSSLCVWETQCELVSLTSESLMGICLSSGLNGWNVGGITLRC